MLNGLQQAWETVTKSKPNEVISNLEQLQPSDGVRLVLLFAQEFQNK